MHTLFRWVACIYPDDPVRDRIILKFLKDEQTETLERKKNTYSERGTVLLFNQNRVGVRGGTESVAQAGTAGVEAIAGGPAVTGSTEGDIVGRRKTISVGSRKTCRATIINGAWTATSVVANGAAIYDGSGQRIAGSERCDRFPDESETIIGCSNPVH